MLVVGDVHGKINMYIRLIADVDCSLQVGDMGFNYRKLKEEVDSTKHKFIGGNHDNYATCPNLKGDIEFWKMPKHYLGDFGNHKAPDETEFWFCRGAYSIDQKFRTIGVSWWPNEELTQARFVDAITSFRRNKPEIVITHDCPSVMYNEIYGDIKTGNSLTEQALSAMLDFHKPKLWIFGHHHKSLNTLIDWDLTNKTKFVCLDELETMEI